LCHGRAGRAFVVQASNCPRWGGHSRAIDDGHRQRRRNHNEKKTAQKKRFHTIASKALDPE